MITGIIPIRMKAKADGLNVRNGDAMVDMRHCISVHIGNLQTGGKWNPAYEHFRDCLLMPAG